MSKVYYNEEVDDAPILNDTAEPVSMPRLYGNIQQATNSIAVSPAQSIQNAIYAIQKLGGGTVQLLPGTFIVSNNIIVPSNVSIVGDATTIIDFGGNAYQILIQGTDAYSTGTVAVSNDGTVVTGTGTTWTSSMEGQSILIGDFWYVIASVASTTSLTLASMFAGTTVTASTYVIATTVNGAMLKGFIVQNSSIALIKWRYVNFITIDGVVAIGGLVGYDGDDSAYMNLFNGTIDSCTTSITLNNCPFGTYWNQIVSNGGGIVADTISNWAIECFSLQNITGDGINLTNCSNTGFLNFAIYEVSGDGIEFVANNIDIQVISSAISKCTGNGVKLTATSDRIIIIGNTLLDNTLYGINIAASSCDDNIIYPNTYSGNGSGTFQDLGTRTISGTNSTDKARAYLASNQSVATATSTKITLNTESYDPGGNFDAVTNYRFTASRAGDYQVTGKFTLQTPVDQTTIQIDIKKNGIDFIRNNVSASGTSDTGIITTDLVALAVNDYIELFASHTSGVNKNVLGGENQTYMTVHLISTG